MDPDSAELSSLTTLVSDAARRVAEIADRRGADPDDPVLARLHEAERALVTVARRLRSIARDLD